MIADFLASWSLFGTTYGVGLLAAAALAQVGVFVVARNQIFLGAAVAQASTLGVALALRAAPLAGVAGLAWLASEGAPAIFAVLASVTTAWLVARPRGPTSESEEALDGWVFLLASSVPVLLLAHSPHGLEEVQRLVFSTLLAASPADLWLFALLAFGGAALTARKWDALLLVSVDPAAATAAGLRPARWRWLSALWLGLAVGLAIRAAGTLYTFGCLVLPPLAARGLCREVRTAAWLAPALAVAAALAGFLLAHAFDVPPAHATVAVLSALLPAVWLRGHPGRAGAGARRRPPSS